jgi:hypothetical protein
MHENKINSTYSTFMLVVIPLIGIDIHNIGMHYPRKLVLSYNASFIWYSS